MQSVSRAWTLQAYSTDSMQGGNIEISLDIEDCRGTIANVQMSNSNFLMGIYITS